MKQETSETGKAEISNEDSAFPVLREEVGCAYYIKRVVHFFLLVILLANTYDFPYNTRKERNYKQPGPYHPTVI